MVAHLPAVPFKGRESLIFNLLGLFLRWQGFAAPHMFAGAANSKVGFGPVLRALAAIGCRLEALRKVTAFSPIHGVNSCSPRFTGTCFLSYAPYGTESEYAQVRTLWVATNEKKEEKPHDLPP